MSAFGGKADITELHCGWQYNSLGTGTFAAQSAFIFIA
jgi:hypothetical protein